MYYVIIIIIDYYMYKLQYIQKIQIQIDTYYTYMYDILTISNYYSAIIKYRLFH